MRNESAIASSARTTDSIYAPNGLASDIESYLKFSRGLLEQRLRDTGESYGKAATAVDGNSDDVWMDSSNMYTYVGKMLRL